MRDHCLVIKSMAKNNTRVPEIYYNFVVDVSRDGLVNIYAGQDDVKQIRLRIAARIKKDKKYLARRFSQEKMALKNLTTLPYGFIPKIGSATKKEIIGQLEMLHSKAYNFSGFFDFTHYLGSLDINLPKKQTKKIGQMHDQRKNGFVNFFQFIDMLCQKITKGTKITNKKLNFLTIEEIIKFLKGELDIKQVNNLQKKRQKKYIYIFKNNKEKIITDNFEKELKGIERLTIEEARLNKEIRGRTILRTNRVIRGKVKIIRDLTITKKLPEGCIVVLPMTQPAMAPYLKKVAAIITDEGGLLCHAANLAREFKIPCIIGTKIATKVLKDGDLVEVDANKGVVRKI